MQTSTLRPGLLVSLKTSIRGNVSYVKEMIEFDTEIAPGKRRSKWDTTRTIDDAAEHEAAVKVRGKARSIVSSVCSNTTFGLLCQQDRADELTKAVEKARTLVKKFNETAKITRLKVFIVSGRIAPDDVEAVSAINDEIATLMTTMAAGIQSLDVEKVREAANRAKGIAQMLSPSAAAQVQIAVEQARSAARKIVAAGEQAAAEIDLRAVRAITEARGAFLDIPGEDDDIVVIAPVPASRSIDLEPIAAE